MNAVEETFLIAKAQCLIALGSALPGKRRISIIINELIFFRLLVDCWFG